MAASGEANQLLEADFVYVRDFRKPDLLTEEQLKHLALIAHYCYRSFDLAQFCLLALEERGHLPKGTNDIYATALMACAPAASSIQAVGSPTCFPMAFTGAEAALSREGGARF